MHKLTECNLCGAKKMRALYTATLASAEEPWSGFLDPEIFPLKISGMVCFSCGWVFQNPIYDDRELDRLYCFQGEISSLEAQDLAVRNAVIRGQRIFSTVEPWLKPDDRHVLDVGGRNGELMGEFAKRGFQIKVLDMDDGMPAFSEITKIRSPFLAWTGDQFDLMAMSHVLEHTHDPSSFLLHAWSLLKEAGLLFVEVPFELLTPLLRRHIGDHRHLGYFSKTTLRSFLEKSGFECLHCECLVDIVGGPTPIIRAVARKLDRSQAREWRPAPLAAVRSLGEVSNYLLWPSWFKRKAMSLRSPAG